MKFSERGIETSAEYPPIPWDEIVHVSASRVDTIESDLVIIELGHESGEFIEIPMDSDDAPEAIKAIGTYLPGVDSNWLDRIEVLEVNALVVVWKRD